MEIRGDFLRDFFFLLSIEIVSRRHMIHILVLMYLFYLRVVYVRGRHYVFIVFMLLYFLFHIWYIDFNLYYEVFHGICLLFYVL